MYIFHAAMQQAGRRLWNRRVSWLGGGGGGILGWSGRAGELQTDSRQAGSMRAGRLTGSQPGRKKAADRISCHSDNTSFLSEKYKVRDV